MTRFSSNLPAPRDAGFAGLSVGWLFYACTMPRTGQRPRRGALTDLQDAPLGDHASLVGHAGGHLDLQHAGLLTIRREIGAQFKGFGLTSGVGTENLGFSGALLVFEASDVGVGDLSAGRQ